MNFNQIHCGFSLSGRIFLVWLHLLTKVCCKAWMVTQEQYIVAALARTGYMPPIL